MVELTLIFGICFCAGRILGIVLVNWLKERYGIDDE